MMDFTVTDINDMALDAAQEMLAETLGDPKVYGGLTWTLRFVDGDVLLHVEFRSYGIVDTRIVQQNVSVSLTDAAKRRIYGGARKRSADDDGLDLDDIITEDARNDDALCLYCDKATKVTDCARHPLARAESMAMDIRN